MTEEIFFKESQRFGQKWLWAIILIPVGFFVYGFIQQIFLGKPFGEHPAPDLVLILTGLLLVGILYMLAMTRLETEIRRAGLYYRYFPFHRRIHHLAWQEVAAFGVRQYRPIREYGGWGIRGLKCLGNMAYNVSGNMGLQLELKNGSRVLFGTQRPQELAQALDHIRGLYPISLLIEQ